MRNERGRQEQGKEKVPLRAYVCVYVCVCFHLTGRTGSMADQTVNTRHDQTISSCVLFLLKNRHFLALTGFLLLLVFHRSGMGNASADLTTTTTTTTNYKGNNNDKRRPCSVLLCSFLLSCHVSTCPGLGVLLLIFFFFVHPSLCTFCAVYHSRPDSFLFLTSAFDCDHTLARLERFHPD